MSNAEALVLGVYPSALHVQWTHPAFRVAALAVDEEPWPFWDGLDQVDRIARWIEDVNWQGTWGSVRPAGRLNGSSGAVLRDNILVPLGLSTDRAWLTDAVPFFHVHNGPGTQGAAMTERYDEFARPLGLPLHALPERPPAHRLIAYAVEHEAERLLEEIVESSTPLLITLGNEALAVAAALLRTELPRALIPDSSYGARHPVQVGGRQLELLPLVHPGQRSAAWRAAHQRWRESTAARRID